MAVARSSATSLQSEKTALVDKPFEKSTQTSLGAMALSRACFAAEPGIKPFLKDLSVTFRPGALTMLVGSVGSVCSLPLGFEVLSLTRADRENPSCSNHCSARLRSSRAI